MGSGSSANKQNNAAKEPAKPAATPAEARKAVSNVVAELETLVIEVGADGAAIERGCAMTEAQQIFVVVDPRAGRTLGEVKCLNDADMLRKVMMGGGGKTTLKIFILLPSSTSSRAHMMNAHMGMYMLGHWLEQEQVNFIRTDDYFHNGDEIMNAMVAQGKTVYPAEERENIMAMLMANLTNLWPKRAYAHWPIGLGLEEGTCNPEETLGKLSPIMGDDERALARIGSPPPEDGTATQAVLASGSKPAFLTFSEDSAGKYGKEILVTEDIFAKIESDELDGDWSGLKGEWRYPVLVVGPGDLVGTPETGTETLLFRFICKWREYKPCMSMCVVLVDESADAFKANCWLGPALHVLIENADMCIFATPSELLDAIGFFTKAKFPEADVAKTAMFQLIPFPRIHFYTMGTALGAELQDGEIWLPAVTVGPAAGGAKVPAVEKFKTQGNPFIFDFPCKRHHDLVIPGEEGFAGATLIHPARLLESICKGVCSSLRGGAEPNEDGEAAPATWATAFGEEFAGQDDMELQEVASNLGDLMSEMTQYLECSNTCDDEEQEECE